MNENLSQSVKILISEQVADVAIFYLNVLEFILLIMYKEIMFKENTVDRPTNDIRDDQIRLELLKFEIRRFSIAFSKNLPKSLNAERKILEKNLTDFQISGLSYFDNEDYLACNTKLIVLELGASVTGMKEEKNLLNSSEI